MFNMEKGSKPYHIFLTGPKHIGKSTLINKILETTDLNWDGIVSVSDFEDGIRHVYLTNAKNPKHENLVGTCNHGKATTSYPQVFDTEGSKLLEIKEGTELFIIDEVGFMENDAKEYTDKLLKLLDRTDVHILGVLRQSDNSYLYSKIRSHENVKTFVIGEANRDNMAPVVDRLLHNIHRD